MRKFKHLTLTLALLIAAVSGAWAQTTVRYAIGPEDPNFTSGQTVEVKDGNDVVATITYGESGGSNFLKLAGQNFDGYKYCIQGNGTNGDKTGGTFYTIVPVYDGTIDVAVILNADKHFYILENGEALEDYNGITVATKTTTKYTFKVSAGKSYKFYAAGGKLSFFGFDYTYGSANAAAAGIDLTPDATRKVWTLDKMPAGNVELNVEYEPTKVTMAANDNTMGTVEVGGESKVEWTADTWQDWPDFNAAMNQECNKTVGDITLYSPKPNGDGDSFIYRNNAGNLSFFINEHFDNLTCTFSTTGEPFTRIEFAMTNVYDPGDGQGYHGNPNIQPADNWTFSDKSAVWEGEATKSLTLKSCSTSVSKITFFQGAIPDGVTVNTDGTFTVAKTATVTLTATPKEGYKFLYWDDDHNNTNPVREVTIESGEADMTYKAVFAEILYNVTFANGIEEADKWSATPNANVKKETKVDIEYTGAKKVIGVKAKKKVEPKKLTVGNVTFYYDEGQTFTEAKQKYADLNSGWILNGPYISVQGAISIVLFKGESPVEGTSKIEPNAEYSWIDFS